MEVSGQLHAQAVLSYVFEENIVTLKCNYFRMKLLVHCFRIRIASVYVYMSSVWISL